MASVFKRGGKKAKGCYYAAWFDHSGRRQTKSTRTTDKATAERIARKYEADAALRRDGVIDPALDEISKQSQRSIDAHLADYESKLLAANKTAKHVKTTADYVRQIAKHGVFNTASDINADAVNGFANLLRDKGRSSRTIQAYLVAIKAFSKWLTENHKLPRDPLASVEKPDPKKDRRHERRILLMDEWRLLEAATEGGPERYGMTGNERSLVYMTAIQTGLRSNELRSLTRGSLHLDATQPFITCKAGSTKNGEPARLYIQPELAARLKEHISIKSPKAPVFSLPHTSNMARMLRHDLETARSEWLSNSIDDPQEYAQRQESDFLSEVNHEGEIFDFHSLRHTCGAWLSMNGTPVKVVQQVMRHQSITLTMDSYGHLFPGQEADAVSRMRDFLIDEQPEPESLRATGTDYSKAQRILQQSGRETGQNGAKRCDDRDNKQPQEKSPKPLRIADLGDEMRDNATVNQSTPSRIRTCDLLIRSQSATDKTPEKTAICNDSAAHAQQLNGKTTQLDRDLEEIIRRWERLPDALKAGILAMVKASDETKTDD